MLFPAEHNPEVCIMDVDVKKIKEIVSCDFNLENFHTYRSANCVAHALAVHDIFSRQSTLWLSSLASLNLQV